MMVCLFYKMKINLDTHDYLSLNWDVQKLPSEDWSELIVCNAILKSGLKVTLLHVLLP